MGVQIIGEDGTLLHEFGDRLGAILLSRLIVAAKFRNDADYDLVLNEHVAELALSLKRATPQPTIPRPDDDLLRQCEPRLIEVFNHHVFTGALKWSAWSMDEKTAYVRDIVFAPFKASDQFLTDFVEDRESYFERWRRALNAGQ